VSEKIHIEEAFEKSLESFRSNSLLLACSGGVDSVVLGHLLHRKGFTFGIAHANYQLRAEESEFDALFVQNLARDFNVPYFSKVFQLDQSKSIQEEARNLRYNWFNALLKSKGYDFVLTAHHEDDSIEGMLMSVFSGASLHRLSGIDHNQWILRPLKDVSKLQLIDYAHRNQIEHRTDSSNTKNEYLRNFVRNQILNDLNKQLSHSDEKLRYSLSYFKRTLRLQNAYRRLLFDEVCTQGAYWEAFFIDKLKAYENHLDLLQLLFEPYGFKDFKALSQLLDAENGKEVSSLSHRVYTFNQQLLLTSLATLKLHYTLSFDDPRKDRKAFKTRVYEVKVRNEAELSAIEVRKWSTSDTVLLRQHKSPKKLSKVLRDMKVNPILKERLHVVKYKDQTLSCLGYDGIDIQNDSTFPSCKTLYVWQE